VVTGTLKLASGEPPCPQSAQPANDAYVAAKVRILARNPRDREGTPWH